MKRASDLWSALSGLQSDEEEAVKRSTIALFMVLVTLITVSKLDAATIVMDFGIGGGSVPITYTEDGFRIRALDVGAGQPHFDVADLHDISEVQEREGAVHGSNNAEDIRIPPTESGGGLTVDPRTMNMSSFRTGVDDD